MTDGTRKRDDLILYASKWKGEGICHICNSRGIMKGYKINFANHLDQ